MLKIKVKYGIDMRLWKYSPPKEEEKPDQTMYDDLLSYISKTFEFPDTKQFRITYEDEDDEMLTIASLEDFQDAFVSAKQENKKSLKLHIVTAAEPDTVDMDIDDDEQDEKKDADAPIQSTLPEKDANNDDNDESGKQTPSTEEIEAFLSDDLMVDLLSDLFVAVFEALQAAQFELSFIECIQGIVMSDDGKYDQLTSHAVWPYFMQQLLPMHAPKMEQFVVPMLKLNAGGMDAQMIKQWIPTILGMMKMHIVNQRQCGGRGRGHRARGRRCGGRGWRGGGRGGWWPRAPFGGPFDAFGNHHGFGDGLPRFNPAVSDVPGSHVPPPPPHHHVSAQPPVPPHAHHPHHHGHHHGHGGRHHHHRGHRGHGHGHGHHHHGHRGWRGRRGGWRGGFNAWCPNNQFTQNQDEGAEEAANGADQNAEPEEEMQEEQEFEYTDELVAIMNMGFGDMANIKRLLTEHQGNKENVIQELVLTKN
jgi:hypothetical protein